MTGDDRDDREREKLTFAERDRLRREGKGAAPPGRRREAAAARSKAESKAQLKQADALFSGGTRAEHEKLAAAMRDAHGTAGLVDACRAFLNAAGVPSDPSLISLFLDTPDSELILAGYSALRAGAESGEISLSGSLRSQLRILAEDPNDDVAEGAEELLEAL